MLVLSRLLSAKTFLSLMEVMVTNTSQAGISQGQQILRMQQSWIKVEVLE